MLANRVRMGTGIGDYLICWGDYGSTHKDALVEASSTLSGEAGNIINGDTSFNTVFNRWVSTNEAQPTVTISWRYGVKIDNIRFYFDREYDVKDYIVEFYKQDSWVELLSVTGNTSSTPSYEFDMIETKMIRIKFGAGITRVHEIVMSGYARIICPELPNIALEGVASSPTGSTGSNTPNNVNNGDRSGSLGRWLSTPGADRILQIDFNEPRIISGVKLFAEPGFPISDFDIQYKNVNDVWITTHEVGKLNVSNTEYLIGNVKGLGVRLKFNAKGIGNYQRVYEFEIYGK